MASTEAQKAKDRGNTAFKHADYSKAIGHYTAAILADGNEHTYPLNRAAAYLKLGKNEDAERDCTTVLRLKSGNVKALYRRAQARTELKKWDDALADLREALKHEPQNESLRSELGKVKELVTISRSKRSTKDPSHTTSATSLPKRRQVPIEIVDSSEDSRPASWSPTETLKPVSTRTFPRNDQSPALTRSPANPSTSASTANLGAPVVNVRGGIFRPSGSHTLYNVPTPAAPNGKEASGKKSPLSEPIQPSPISLFDFTRAWGSAAGFPEMWDLLQQVPPPALPSLFKSSLEAAHLTSAIEVFSHMVSTTGDVSIKAKVRDYMQGFARVPRFATILLFMNKSEKELARALSDAVGDVDGWGL